MIVMKNAATTGQVCLCRNVIAVRESEGLDVDDLAHLLHRYLRLDDEMLQVSVRWRDCFHLIEQYNDEQVKPPESVYLRRARGCVCCLLCPCVCLRNYSRILWRNFGESLEWVECRTE